ncbi:MAG: rod-binding protein [Armatimonadetes bacterium]|nr:rod-binding protein [Armatimonadota bacterium]
MTVVENPGMAFGTVLRATSLRLTLSQAPPLTAPSLAAPPLAAPSLAAPSLTAPAPTAPPTAPPASIIAPPISSRLAPPMSPPPAPPIPGGIRAAQGRENQGLVKPGGEVPEDLKKAAADLEAFFLSYLFKQMRSTLPKNKLFGGGLDQEMFTSMLDEERAKVMALRGGIGLQEMVIRQLRKSP